MINCNISWCKFNIDGKCSLNNVEINWEHEIPVCDNFVKIFSDRIFLQKELSTAYKKHPIIIERYKQDPQFHALVNVMVANILDAEYKMLDVWVDAAIVAHILGLEHKCRKAT